MTQALYNAAKAVTEFWDEGGWRYPSSGRDAEAMGALKRIVNNPNLLATPEEIDSARCEDPSAKPVIDDFAYASRGDDGTWVQAWVWLPSAQQTNEYTCPTCGHEWEDQWTCAANDDCPACGERDIQPDGEAP